MFVHSLFFPGFSEDFLVSYFLPDFSKA